jgi:phosphotransferase system HPr (HPr) family protein
MNGDTLSAKVVIINPVGLHMRPAGAVARRANLFAGPVTVAKGTMRVNAKSMTELLFLIAEQGTELVVEVGGTGPEAQAALAEILEILAAPSMDDDEPPTG